MIYPLLLLCCSAFLNGQPLIQDDRIQDGLRQFTSELLQNLEASTNSNFVLSPYSLHSTFSQLAHGAGGDTQLELERVLGVNATEFTRAQYRLMVDGLAAGSSQLKVSNLMAVAEGFKPKNEYKQGILQDFRSDIREYDFADSLNSINEINQYVADATNQKITELLAEGDVDSLTRLILINAIYFKDNWKTEFDPAETFQTEFESNDGRNIRTDFMNMNVEVRVLEDREVGVDILELPYNDPNKSMLIVLPRHGESTDHIAERIQNISLSSVRTNGRFAETNVSIPKFKLKYQTYLKAKMEELGAGQVFTRSADLSAMSDETLYASEGIHQAFIEVNEEGTEAAAATAVVVGLRTAQRKRQFFANRPFLFVVYDFGQDVALFAGKVVDPSNDTIIQRKADLQIDDGFQSQQTQTQRPVSSKKCKDYFRDFPNSLENTRICQTIMSEGKKFDWLTKNRALCEQSMEFYETFLNHNCGFAWCQDARNLTTNWNADYNNYNCETIQDRVETPQIKKHCRTTGNRLKALNSLQCNQYYD